MTGVVVVTWNSQATIAACLASIPAGVPVVVVDNASEDETLARVRAARPEAAVRPSERNLGFGAACNLGARALAGHDLLFLNPDAELEPGALEGLEGILKAQARVGAVGPSLRQADGLLEWSWGEDPSLRIEWRRRRAHAQLEREPGPARVVDWVTGGCCLVRREAWEAGGGFDERYFLYFEDLDLCRRLRMAGYQVYFEPAARARHQRGASAGRLGVRTERHYRESQLYYYETYAPVWERLGLRAYLWAAYARRPAPDADTRAAYRAIARRAWR